LSSAEYDNSQRRIAVKESKTVNGIDYLDVFTNKIPDSMLYPSTSEKSFKSLVLIHCLKPITGIPLNEDNVLIEGGIRTKNINAEWAYPASAILADSNLSSKLLTKDEMLIDELRDTPEKILVVRPDKVGDMTLYTLQLVSSDDYSKPPPTFDTVLSKTDFSFRLDCLDDSEPFEKLTPENIPTLLSSSEPTVDYMSKDYASFRKLMLDRLSLINPKWNEQNPADMGIAIIEMLAYVGDNLSYYQDAVATEAYLSTSRQRISVRRHARLLDYFINEGCNSRVWITMQANDVLSKNKNSDDPPILIPEGTKLLTNSFNSTKTVVRPVDFDREIKEDTQVFETMHDVEIYPENNEINFYTWGDPKYTLSKGAMSATLYDDNLTLHEGDVLIFEEIRSPITWRKSDRDISHKHAVRLTSIVNTVDELTATPIVEVSWAEDDALPFSLCLWEKNGADPDSSDADEFDKLRISVAYGNVVLADHGNTINNDFSVNDSDVSISASEFIGNVPIDGKFSPRISQTPLTFSSPFDPKSSASSALNYSEKDAEPQILILGDDETWFPVKDLISSDKHAYDFVVEVDNDNHANIRFGDEKTDSGNIPIPSSPDVSNPFFALYRIGNGVSGNVGPDTITHVVADLETVPVDEFVVKIRNPMNAVGGKESESIDDVKQFAPYEFLKQERAVNEQDYVKILEKHPEIQNASASIRWTGSWHTLNVTIDRKGHAEVDDAFIEKIEKYLEAYRLAGHEIRIKPPRFVALDIAMHVCIDPNYLKKKIKEQLLDIFGNYEFADSLGVVQRGLFHPDNLTFGQSIFLSHIYEAAMRVDGVVSVQINQFKRFAESENNELENGFLSISSSEIPRLDNDSNFQENGVITFTLEGGL
jgi:hypothetical protein